MSKKKQIKKAPISSEIVPNKAEPKEPQPTTMTEFYQHWYKTLFNKLPKEEQDLLTANLKRGAQIVRGQVREFSNVRNFVRSVIEKAEDEFDKFKAKQAVDAQKKTGGADTGGSASIPKGKGGGGKGGDVVANAAK